MKNLIRVIVVLGLLAWPGLEIYRIQAAKQQLAESEILGRSISQKLASLEKQQKVAASEGQTQDSTPVSSTATPTPSQNPESQ